MSAGVALPVGCVDISIRMATWSSHGVLLSLLFAERFATQLDAMGVVDDTIQDRVGESWVTKHLVMPQCLTGESLKCGWLIRTILFMASAFRSAVAARDGDRG